MNIARTTEREIFQAVKARVISKIPEANELTCWIDDAPLPLSKDPPPHERSFTISPVDGMFDDGLQTGGSLCGGMMEHSGIVITYMQKLTLDMPKRLDIILAESRANAMLDWQKKILAAMLVDYTPNVSGTIKTRWNPVNSNGDALFANQIRPKLIVKPKRHQDWPLLYLYVEFAYSFVWDIG